MFDHTPTTRHLPIAHNGHRNSNSPETSPVDASPAASPTIGGSASSPCACGGGCPRCRSADDALSISDADGASEAQADSVADRLFGETSQGAAPPPDIRDIASPTGAAGQDKTTPDSVHRTITEAGHPLPAALRNDWSSRLGHDLRSVRVHVGAVADYSTRDIDADAYAVGHHVVFAHDNYSPETPAGRHLIAHEVAHTLQQRHAPQPQVQRRLRGHKRKTLSDLVDSAFDYLARQKELARQDAYVRSIVGDYVQSKQLLSYRFERVMKTEKYKDSTLTTETYYIVVEQKNDDQNPKTPWSLLVDRHTTFNLHGKISGSMSNRDAARLSQSTAGKRPTAAKDIPAYVLTPLHADVRFDRPVPDFVHVEPKPAKADTYGKLAAGHTLFDLAAVPKKRIDALEKLLKPPAPAALAKHDVTVPKPTRPTSPPKPPKQIDEDIDDDKKRRPSKKTPVPVSPSTPMKDLVDAGQSRDGDKKIEVEDSVDKEEDHEDHWYDGLLRALGTLAFGLTILMGLALLVAGATYALAGVVITATVAIAVAGSMLLAYGIYQALEHRLNQKEFAGRPGAAIGRALLDAVGVTGLQEAINGDDVVTGEKLTPGERVERGFLGGVNLLTMLWGARGALKGGPKTAPPTRAVPEPLPRPDPVPIEPPSQTPRVEPGAARPPPEPVPAEPVPVAPTPVEPAPVEPAPVDPAPVEPVPDTSPPDKVTPPKRQRSRKPRNPTDSDPSVPKRSTKKQKAKPPAGNDAPDSTENSKEPSKPKTAKSSKPAKPTMPVEDPLHNLRTAIERLKNAIKDDYADLERIDRNRIAAKARIEALKQQSPKALDKIARAERAFTELDEQYKFRADELSRKAQLRDRYVSALTGKLYDRPGSFADEFIQKVWNDAKTPDRKVFSPSGTEIKPGDPWVMGHKWGLEFWKHQLSAARRALTRKQFIDEYYKTGKFRPETVKDNSSHAYEAPDNIYNGD